MCWLAHIDQQAWEPGILSPDLHGLSATWAVDIVSLATEPLKQVMSHIHNNDKVVLKHSCIISKDHKGNFSDVRRGNFFIKLKLSFVMVKEA